MVARREPNKLPTYGGGEVVCYTNTHKHTHMHVSVCLTYLYIGDQEKDTPHAEAGEGRVDED